MRLNWTAPSVVDAAESSDEKTRRTAARVAAVRHAARKIRNRDALQKLFGELAERYRERPGGYTRIIKVGRRLGDGADMSIIELVGRVLEEAELEPEVDDTEADETETETEADETETAAESA